MAEEGTGTAPEASSSTEGGQVLLDQGGSGNLLDWRSSLPENLRGAPIIQEHHTQEAAAKTLVAQAEMIGRGIYLPKEEPGTDAYHSAMQKVYEKLGRPGKAEEYALPVPEGRTFDAEVQSRFAKAFHAEGLSQKQVDGVMAEYWRTVEYAENVAAGREQESYQVGRNALFAEFGASTEREMALAQKFVEHFGAGAFSGEAGGKLWEQLRDARLPDGARLINSPYMVATFAEAMRRLGEGEFVDSTFYTPGQNTLQTMETRQKELTAKRHASSGLTQNEFRELMTLNTQVSAARERQSRGRVA